MVTFELASSVSTSTAIWNTRLFSSLSSSESQFEYDASKMVVPDGAPLPLVPVLNLTPSASDATVVFEIVTLAPFVTAVHALALFQKAPALSGNAVYESSTM